MLKTVKSSASSDDSDQYPSAQKPLISWREFHNLYEENPTKWQKCMARVRPQRHDKDSSPDAWVKRVKHLTLIKDKPHQSVFRLWLVRICEKCRSIILEQKSKRPN